MAAGGSVDYLSLALQALPAVSARAWLADVDATVMVLQAFNVDGCSAAQAASAVAKKTADVFGAGSFVAARAAAMAAAARAGARSDSDTWLDIWRLFDDCRDFVTMTGQFAT